MSSLQKYRVHEVAKDFGLTSKVVTDIMTEFLTTPKNHMQVLTDAELNLIFDVITQRNQVESFEKLMSEAYTAPAEEAPAEKPAKEEKSAAPKADAAPKVPKAEKPKDAPAAPKKSNKITTVHHLDTRASSVDLSKYDDHAESLVPESAKRMKQGME